VQERIATAVSDEQFGVVQQILVTFEYQLPDPSRGIVEPVKKIIEQLSPGSLL